MSEFEETVQLAERILDRPNADPDDDESMLARQFLRSIETESVCEALTRRLELAGEEMFEKNFVKDGKIIVSVFCIIGPNAEEMTGLVREWASKSGFNRTT